MSFRHTPPVSARTFVVAADRAKARFLVGTWPHLADISEQETLLCPESRARQHDTVSDSPGRFRTPGGSPTAAEPVTDFQHQTAATFARRIIERLEAGRTHEEFGRWILVAPPLMLGELRNACPAPLAALRAGEVEKELVHLRPEEILAHVKAAVSGK